MVRILPVAAAILLLVAAVSATLPADRYQLDHDNDGTDEQRSLFMTAQQCKGTTLAPGGKLYPNEYICATDPDDGSSIRFGLNFIGILLFYKNDKVVWSSKKRGDYLVFQEDDAHLVLYSTGNRVAWSSQCFGRGRAKAAEINFGGSSSSRPGLLLVDDNDNDVWFLGTDGSLAGCYPDPKTLLVPPPSKEPAVSPPTKDVSVVQDTEPGEQDWDDEDIPINSDGVGIDCSNMRGRAILSTTRRGDPLLTMRFVLRTPKMHPDYPFTRAERTAGGTLTVQLSYEYEGWVALGLSKKGKMVDSEPVICLPNENDVSKYAITRKRVSGIVPRSRQTLADTALSQADGVTECRWAKRLLESGEIPIRTSRSNTFVWAVGNENDLSYHWKRGSVDISFAQCGIKDDAVEVDDVVPELPRVTPKPRPSPTPQPRPKATPRPSSTPTIGPTDKPTRKPTNKPTDKPVEMKTNRPTLKPTMETEIVEPDVVNNNPGITSFFVMGDAPYNDREMTHWVPRQIEKIPYDADFVFHVGNQMLPASSKCNIMWNMFMRDTALAKSAAPVFITPGENDYVRCRGKIETSDDDVEVAWQNWKDTYLRMDKMWPHPLPVKYHRERPENFSFLLKRTLVISFHMINGPVVDAAEWVERHKSNYEFIKDRLDHHANNYDAVVLLTHAKPTDNHKDFFSRLTFKIVTNSRLKSIPWVYIHGGGKGIYEEEERFLNMKNFLRIQIEGRKRNPINIMIDTTSGGARVKIDRNDKTVWSVCCNPWLEGWAP